jgi:hypothetical protein
MDSQDFDNLVVIKRPCPIPSCWVGRHYHHYIDDYYFCDCGWKKAGEHFIPETYEGDDWDIENNCFILNNTQVSDDQQG